MHTAAIKKEKEIWLGANSFNLLPVIFFTSAQKTCQQSAEHSFHLSSFLRSLPVSPLLLRREKALHFLHLSPCLSQSICVSTHGCRHPFFPHLALSFQMHLAASLCLRKPETAGNRQADGQTDRECHGVFWLCLSATLSHQISSFPLMCLLYPFGSLFLLSIPINLFRVCSLICSQLLQLIIWLGFLSLPHSSPLFYPTNSSAYLPSVFFPHSHFFFLLHTSSCFLPLLWQVPWGVQQSP